MAYSKQKRKNSSKYSKLIHIIFFFIDKVYKILRVLDLIIKIFY